MKILSNLLCGIKTNGFLILMIVCLMFIIQLIGSRFRSLLMTEWIKCSERLPEDYQSVLAWIIPINTMVVCYFTKKDGKLVWAVPYSHSWWDLDLVSYWHSLPQPP